MYPRLMHERQSNKDQVIVPFTLRVVSILLCLIALLTANLLPRMDCIYKYINMKLQTCISYINHGLDVRMKHKSNTNILHIIFWDKKNISFIDITTITYNEIDNRSMNLVEAPLHQAPSAPPRIFLISHFFSGNGMGSYGGEREK